MSNLKNRLNKTASSNSILEALQNILENEISKKVDEIGWKEGTNGIIELVNANMDANYGIDIHQMANAMYEAIELWAEETQENFPNGTLN
jgi:hypothetical protein